MVFAARTDGPLSDMNITPLVDVMLVLLIIFMVTAPLLGQSLGIGVSRPGEASEHAPPPVLRVEAGDVLSLDRVAMSRGELARSLRTLSIRNPEQPLKVDIHPDADYQSVTTALALARSAGVENLQFDWR